MKIEIDLNVTPGDGLSVDEFKAMERMLAEAATVSNKANLDIIIDFQNLLEKVKEPLCLCDFCNRIKPAVESHTLDIIEDTEMCDDCAGDAWQFQQEFKNS